MATVNETLPIKRAFLVYKAGIANVFQVDCMNISPFGRNAKRLMQSDFRSCAHFAQGLAAAGVIVDTVACNKAGDITDETWDTPLEEAPFSDKQVTVLNREVLNSIEWFLDKYAELGKERSLLSVLEIDWEVLRAEKEWLETQLMRGYSNLTTEQEKGRQMAEGLLSLIDAIQDRAAKVLGEEKVLG